MSNPSPVREVSFYSQDVPFKLFTSSPWRQCVAVATLLLLMAATSASVFGAQKVQDTPPTTDIHFHKFVPKIAPGQNAAAQTMSQAGNTDQAVAQQILALQQEKASRTAAQQKIDSNVLYTIRMLRGEAPAPGVASLDTGIDLDDNDNVVVDITANVSQKLLQQLKDAKALILYSNPGYRAIRAVVPSQQIEGIAASPDVTFVGRKQEALLSGIRRLVRSNALALGAGLPGSGAHADRIRRELAAAVSSGTVTILSPGQGSVDTQGDLTHRAADARAVFGVTGAGLKIGVLSDSVNATGALTKSQASGDMPPTCGTPVVSPCITVLQDQPNRTDEGEAMLEIVHDMAPGADLLFATADAGEASFASNILALRAAGCDIIVDDVFYFDEPVFQDGIVAQAVSSVTTGGALYFSSAGNEGNVDANTAGYFEGDFNDNGSAAFTFPGGAKTGTVHNFGTVATPLLGDVLTARGEAYTLNWADPQGASGNDYDLFVVSSTGVVKASSTNIQNGTQNAFEQITPGALAAGDRLVVFKTAAASSLFFSINTLRGTLTSNTPGQTHGHSSAAGVGVYSVAATPAAAAFNGVAPVGPFPNAFNAGNSAETFTSDGPRRVFFNADGTAITPGDFSSTGGVVRNKPDITAADGVSTTLPPGSGLNPFYGTSAAAPAAASVAALVKSAKPALTQTEMRATLTGTAIDIQAAGYDRDTGFGIVMAWEAIKSLGVTGTANPVLAVVTASENPGNGNGVIEPGEGAKLAIQLKNDTGVLDATGITATLTTSTPGVTITQPGISAFADMLAGTGAGSNLSPFTFTMASNASCGLAINFTLTVNYTGGPQRVLPFTVQTGLVTLSNNLGSLPAGGTGITTATGAQTNRVTRNGAASSCAAPPKAYPGTTATGGTRVFDSYTFTATQAGCLASTLTSTNGVNLFEVIYSLSFDPTNVATNYAADPGASGSPQNCSVTTVAGTPYTIVVQDVPGTATGSAYTLQVPSCLFAATLNHAPIAVAHDVTVTATTVGGTASANINNGSSDPDGDPLTITQSPAGPYPVGVNSVLLTVVDSKGATAQATATVTVVNPVPTADLSAGTLTFAAQVANTSSSQSVTIKNNGTGQLTFSATPVIGGTNASEFVVAASGTTCTNGASVAAGATCAVNVTFTPTAGGARGPATLTLTDNASPTTQTITLNGTGSDFTVSSASTAAAPAGRTFTFTITVTPSAAGFANAITFSAAGLPAKSAATFSPASVTPGGAPATTTMTVTTTAASAVPFLRLPASPRKPQMPVWLVFGLMALLLSLLRFAKSGSRLWARRLLPLTAVLVLAGAAFYLNGCGGMRVQGTPAGSSTITITATSGGLTHTTGATLVVQ
ncbi:MAG TPA: S8 family serine peptidase [Candidatus Acidoferrum sp.]|jgi:hypothetical protein